MTLHRDLLQELERNVALLREIAQLSREEFLSNPRHYLLAERCFQLAIQCAMDVGYSLAALKGWQRPADGRDAILLLGRQGILERDFAEGFSRIANFRNILVHAYLGINRNLVYDYLSRLGDFDVFVSSMERYFSSNR